MRRRHRLQVDTFPFLAVLLCAMGALILILLVMDRRSRLAAAARARESALLARRAGDASAEKAYAIRDAEQKALDAKLAAERKALDEEMRLVQARLAEVARELRQDEEGVGNLRSMVQGKRSALEADEQSRRAARKEAETLKAALTEEERARQSLAAELVQLEGVIRDLKETRKRDAQTYSVIPYKGKHGEQRAPLYVECTRRGHLFHPDRFELIGPSTEALRLEILRRVTRVAEKRHRAGLKEERPYLLMLIRPEGVMSYYQAQSAVRELPVEFGYEFIDADWVLTVPPEEAELAGTEEPTLTTASPTEPIRKPGSGTPTGSMDDIIGGRLSSGGDGGRGGSAGGGVIGGNGFGPPGNGSGGPGSTGGSGVLFGSTFGPGGGGGPAGIAGRPPSNLALLGLGGTGGDGGYGSGGSLFGGLGGSRGGTTRGGPGGDFGNAPGGPGTLPGRSPGDLMAGGPGGSSGNTPGGGGGQGGATGRSTGGPTGNGVGGPMGDTFGGTGGGGSPAGMAGRPPSNVALLGLGGTGGNGGYGRPGGSGGSLLGGPGGSGNGTPGGSAGERGGSGQATAGLGGRSTGSPPAGGGDPNRSPPALFGMRTGSGGGTPGAPSSPIPLPDDGSGRPGRANPDGPTKSIFENSIPPAAGDAVAKASSAIRIPSILPTVAAPAGGAGGNASGGTGTGSPGSGSCTAGSRNASPGGSGSGGSSNEPVAQGDRRPPRPGFHGPDSLAPPPRQNRPLQPARIGAAEEMVVFIECRSAGVVVLPLGKSIPLADLERASADNPLLRTVAAQLALHKGIPARRQVRFLIHRDAERTFHAAYPLLDEVKVDKTRYTLRPEDDVSRLILVE